MELAPKTASQVSRMGTNRGGRLVAPKCTTQSVTKKVLALALQNRGVVSAQMDAFASKRERRELYSIIGVLSALGLAQKICKGEFRLLTPAADFDKQFFRAERSTESVSVCGGDGDVASLADQLHGYTCESEIIEI